MKVLAEQTKKLEVAVAELEETESRYSAALDIKKTDAQTLTAQKHQLDSEYEQYCTWNVAYELQQTKRETERKERQTLFSLHNDMASKWSTSKGRLERLQKDLARSAENVKDQTPKIHEAEIRIQSICDEIAQKNKEAEELEALLAKIDEADSPIDLGEQEDRLTHL